MANYNPYLVDEIVAGMSTQKNDFGLIRDENEEQTELYGYEITLDGRIVVPSLNPGLSYEFNEVEA